MLEKQNHQMFTESKLKRLIKIAEIQKGVIRKQRKQLRIYTLYLDLLEQWLQEEQQVEIKSGITNELVADGSKEMKNDKNTESLDEIFDSFLENSQDYKSNVKHKNKGLSHLNTEMEQIILKDKIITDISNSNSKVKSNTEQVVHQVKSIKKSEATPLMRKSADEDEIEIPIKERTSSGQIVGSSYQCFEIDFDILNEYIKEYLVELEDLHEALEKEKELTQGYIFLLAKERKKVEITQQQLLKKYQLESKYMKMLRGLWKVGKTEYQEKVKRVLELVYEHEENKKVGSNFEVIFSTPHVRWSVENIEFEQIAKQHINFNLNMDLNEILDDITQCKDNINEYCVVTHMLNHDSEFLIEYDHLYFSKDELDLCVDENVNGTNDDGNTSDSTVAINLSPDKNKVEESIDVESNQNSTETSTNQKSCNMPGCDVPGSVDIELHKTKNEFKKENEIADSEFEMLLDDLETKNGNSLSSSASDIEKLLDDLEINQEDDLSDSKLDKTKLLQDLQNLPKQYPIGAHKKLNLASPSPAGKLRKLKEECRDIFFSPQIMQPFQVPKQERSSSLPTFQRNNTKRKICRTRERIKSDGCISRTHPDKNDIDQSLGSNSLQQLNKMNLFNIQTIFVDGEMVKIADFAEKTGFDSPRNQPRKLSFRKRSLKGVRPNL